MNLEGYGESSPEMQTEQLQFGQMEQMQPRQSGQPGQMEETGSEQKQPGQTQSNQVTDHIELTSPLVKGTGAGNEECHGKKYSRTQETENELEEK